MKKIIASLSLLFVLSTSMLCLGMNEDGSQRGLPKAYFQAMKPYLFEVIERVKNGGDAREKETYQKYLQEKFANAEKSLANNDADSEYVRLIREGEASGLSGWGKPPAGVRMQYTDAISTAIVGVRYIKLGCYPENAVGFDFQKECGLRKISSQEYEGLANKPSSLALFVEASRDLAQILLKELGEENK